MGQFERCGAIGTDKISQDQSNTKKSLKRKLHVATACFSCGLSGFCISLYLASFGAEL